MEIIKVYMRLAHEQPTGRPRVGADRLEMEVNALAERITKVSLLLSKAAVNNTTAAWEFDRVGPEKADYSVVDLSTLVQSTI
jgi:hypothetical protein